MKCWKDEGRCSPFAIRFSPAWPSGADDEKVKLNTWQALFESGKKVSNTNLARSERRIAKRG
jgi:hypothetical protein